MKNALTAKNKIQYSIYGFFRERKNMLDAIYDELKGIFTIS